MREPGFEDGVDIWVEGLPEGATATKGSIRAGQYFGPSDDGDNVIIPHTPLKIAVPVSVAPRDYRIRVLGKATAGGGPVVEAFTTLWIGAARQAQRHPAAGAGHDDDRSPSVESVTVGFVSNNADTYQSVERHELVGG